jgi:hypothetical protein
MDKILRDIARSLKGIEDSLKKIERNMRAEVREIGIVTIEQARKRIIDAFNTDPDFRRTYVDNVACVIMDNLPELKGDKEKRDDLADKIIKHIFA